MAGSLTFRTINQNQLAWHPELEGDAREWFYLDGWMDNGYKYSLVMASKMEMGENIVGPEKADWPLIDCQVTSPEGETQRIAAAFPIEELELKPWGVKIGPNIFQGSLKPDGTPEGYRVKVAHDDIGIEITAEATAIGVRFVEEEHGYMYYDPATNVAIGWWPLIPRSKIAGTLTFHGNTISVTGLGYCERQLGNMAFAGWISRWFWGHLYAGDYTAIWADVISPESLQYRHFSPFVLWKGSDIVLSTHNLTLSPERYEIDHEIGMPFPTTETLHATDGNFELTAVILPGTITERDLMTQNPGTSPEKPGCYFRQSSEIDVEIRRWDRLEHIRGTCIHESGWITQLFPVYGR